MRAALLSDVHANLPALDAVLTAVESQAPQVDAIWVMGDLVGYGPDPAEVLARLREVGAACVQGNHDAAAAGLIGVKEFNENAAKALAWTRTVVGEEDCAYLASLPLTATDAGCVRVHGSLRGPLWEYLGTAESFSAHFALQLTPISISGHTHRPLVVWRDARGDMDSAGPEDGETVALTGQGQRWYVNPGGVGQPRDGDPRAAWALLDTDERTVRFHRVDYDIPAVQARMAAAGLPEMLIRRLALGR